MIVGWPTTDFSRSKNLPSFSTCRSGPCTRGATEGTVPWVSASASTSATDGPMSTVGSKSACATRKNVGERIEFGLERPPMLLDRVGSGTALRSN